jgi:putative DNA primase/helicase
LRAVPERGRGGDADVAEVRLIVADIDWHDPQAHTDADLPPEAAVRNLVDSFEHPPTATVETGHGLQLYWELTGPVDPDAGKVLIDRMHLALADHGLRPEGEDLARVLRVPSTLNFKTDPVEVRVAATTATKYEPRWLDRHLPNCTSSTSSTRKKAKWRKLDESQLHPADVKALRLLEQAGGHDAFIGGDDTVCVLRPGKDSGSSATIGFAGPGMVRVFSSQWPPFKQDTTYDLDQIRALLNGDAPAQHAAKELHHHVDHPRARLTLTDLGNGRRLVRDHGRNLHHVPQIGIWMRWGGTCWEEDVTGEVMRCAKSVADHIIDEAKAAEDDDTRRAIVKHWLVSQNASRLRAMVDVASTERGVPVRIEELDSDPWVLNTATFTVDLRSGLARPHRREDLITKRAAEYKPGSPIDAWLTFLEQIFEGDVELIDFVQRSVGVGLRERCRSSTSGSCTAPAPTARARS